MSGHHRVAPSRGGSAAEGRCAFPQGRPIPLGAGPPVRKDDGAMSLFRTLLQAVQSWRRRRGHWRTPTRAAVAMEQLDHRQLLSVNFTGNVLTDFPETTTPGVVVLRDNPAV